MGKFMSNFWKAAFVLLCPNLLAQGFNVVVTSPIVETSPYFWQVPTLNTQPNYAVTNPPDWNAFQPASWSDYMTPPAQGSLTANYWRQGNTNDTLQKGGLGFDTSPNPVNYTPFLDLDSTAVVKAEMYGKETRANLRIPFTIDPSINLSSTIKAELVLRYEDGLGIWISNSAFPLGQKLLSQFEPASNTAYPPARDDVVASTPTSYDITELFKTLARTGQNVLCARVYNSNIVNSDLLIQTKLIISLPGTNHSPIAISKSINVPLNTPVPVTLTATDFENEVLSYSILTNPSHGTLTGTGPTLTYTPATNYNGLDTFTFRAFDGSSYSLVATVMISIGNFSDMVLIGSHPTALLTGYPTIHSIKAFQGRLYTGYGDWNDHPACLMVCFEPATNLWRCEFAPGADSLGVIREIDGTLYAPHTDPIYYEDLQDFSYLKPGTGWRNRTPIGFYNAFDFCKAGEDLFFCGSKDSHEGPPTNALLMRSSNGGRSWAAVNPTHPSYGRYYWCFSMNGDVFTQGGKWTPSGWVDGSQLATFPKLYKPIVLNSTSGPLMAALADRSPGLSSTSVSSILTFDGATVRSSTGKFIDITHDGTDLYAVNTGGIYRVIPQAGGNLSFELLPITRIPSTTSSLEVMEGRAWIGDTAGRLWCQKLDGSGIPDRNLPTVENVMPDGFGRSIIFDGPEVIVASHEAGQTLPSDNSLIPAAGLVSSWAVDGAIGNRSWTTGSTFAPPSPMISGWFGKDLSVYNGLLGVVEAGYDLTKYDRGSAARVHLYQRVSGGWFSRSILSIPFAHSVAVGTDIVVVGSANPASNQFAGTPSLYRYTVSRPANNGAIDIPVASKLSLVPVVNNWGYKPTARCAMNDSYILGGFSGDVSRNGGVGMISLWNRAAVTTATTTAPAPVQEISTVLPDRFGFSIAISSQFVAVGAPRDDTAAKQAGAVYIYEITTAAQPLVLRQKLLCPVNQDEAAFGSSIALRGDTLLVGAPGVDAAGVAGRGSVYIYRNINGNWVGVGELLPPFANEGALVWKYP